MSMTQKPRRCMGLDSWLTPDTPPPRSLPHTQNCATGTRQAAGVPLPADDNSSSRGPHLGPPLGPAPAWPGAPGSGTRRPCKGSRRRVCAGQRPASLTNLPNPQLSSGNGNALFSFRHVLTLTTDFVFFLILGFTRSTVGRGGNFFSSSRTAIAAFFFEIFLLFPSPSPTNSPTDTLVTKLFMWGGPLSRATCFGGKDWVKVWQTRITSCEAHCSAWNPGKGRLGPRLSKWRQCQCGEFWMLPPPPFLSSPYLLKFSGLMSPKEPRNRAPFSVPTTQGHRWSWV